jgi:hypothetical protein
MGVETLLNSRHFSHALGSVAMKPDAKQQTDQTSRQEKVPLLVSLTRENVIYPALELD